MWLGQLWVFLTRRKCRQVARQHRCCNTLIVAVLLRLHELQQRQERQERQIATLLCQMKTIDTTAYETSQLCKSRFR